MSKLRFKDVNKIAYGFVTYISKLWSKKWQPTPVFLPGKSHGQRSLAGYSPWGRKELDTTEQLSTCQSWHWTQIQLVQRFIHFPQHRTGSMLHKSPGLCTGIEPVARLNKTEPLLKVWQFHRLNKQDLGLGGREVRWMRKLELVRNFMCTSILVGFFWLHHVACGILFPWSGMEPQQ